MYNTCELCSGNCSILCISYMLMLALDVVSVVIAKCTYSICIICTVYIQSGPEKIAQSLMHCHFATVCSRIMRFSSECLEINW